jgi:hypothetical protein
MSKQGTTIVDNISGINCIGGCNLCVTRKQNALDQVNELLEKVSRLEKEIARSHQDLLDLDHDFRQALDYCNKFHVTV